MNRVFASTSVRLALGFAGLFIAASLLLVGILWWRTAGYLDRETNAVVVAETRAIGDRLRDFGLAGAMDTIRQRVDKTIDKNAIYLLTDPALTPLAVQFGGLADRGRTCARLVSGVPGARGRSACRAFVARRAAGLLPFARRTGCAG